MLDHKALCFIYQTKWTHNKSSFHVEDTTFNSRRSTLIVVRSMCAKWSLMVAKRFTTQTCNFFVLEKPKRCKICSSGLSWLQSSWRWRVTLNLFCWESSTNHFASTIVTWLKQIRNLQTSLWINTLFLGSPQLLFLVIVSSKVKCHWESFQVMRTKRLWLKSNWEIRQSSLIQKRGGFIWTMILKQEWTLSTWEFLRSVTSMLCSSSVILILIWLRIETNKKLQERKKEKEKGSSWVVRQVSDSF